MNHLVWLFWLMLGTRLLCIGQNTHCLYSLKGQILDSHDGEPIPFASVYIKEVEKGMLSDSNGVFSLSNLCTGNYTLLVRHLNHKEHRVSINLKESMVKKIYMDCHSDTLHDVKIRSKRIHWEDVSVVNKIQGKELFMASGSTLGKTLEKVNGVYNLSSGANIQKPIIRGLYGNRIVILNNGIRQEGQQWGNEHAPEIDPMLAQQIEVIKGPQTMRYGSDLIGGLILLSPKSIFNVDKMAGNISYNFFSNGRANSLSGMIESNSSKLPGFTYRLQSTFRRGGNARTPEYYLSNTGLKEINFSSAFGYRRKRLEQELFLSVFNTQLGILSGSHIGNLTDLYNAFQASRPFDSSGFTYHIGFPHQKVEHVLAKYSLTYDMLKHGKLHIMLGYQDNTRREYDKSTATKLDDGSYKPALHFKLRTLNYDIQWAHRAYKRWTGSMGINGFYQNNVYLGFYFIPNFQKNLSGFYVTEKWHKNRSSLEWGLRYDLNSFRIQKWEKNNVIDRMHFYHGAAANASFRQQGKYTTLHLNAGTAWRAPHVNELYSFGVHQSAATFEIGDSLLKPERSFNVSATLDIHIKNKWNAEITLFHNYIRNFINLQPQLPATLTIRGAFPTFAFKSMQTSFLGLEGNVNYQINNAWLVTFKGAYIQGRDLSNKRFLIGVPPLRLQSELEYIIMEKGQNELTLNLEVLYTARQNLIRLEDDYVAPPPSYWLWNTGVYFQTAWRKQSIIVHLGAQNLSNTRYRDYLNRNRYFAAELGRNFFIKCNLPF